MRSKYTLATTSIIAAVAVIELAMGRLAICKCGYVKIWHGIVYSSENSQHLTDWYTFSHVLHGIGFYFLLWLAARRLKPETRFVLAVLFEAAWEVAENTPFIIDRYRAATISLDYFGDSIINSVADVFAMMLGFWIAAKMPARVSLALFIGVEIFLAMMIRDNLTLNIIMLIHPVEAVKHWQMGGS